MEKGPDSTSNRPRKLSNFRNTLFATLAAGALTNATPAFAENAPVSPTPIAETTDVTRERIARIEPEQSLTSRLSPTIPATTHLEARPRESRADEGITLSPPRLSPTEPATTHLGARPREPRADEGIPLSPPRLSTTEPPTDHLTRARTSRADQPTPPPETPAQ